MKVNYILKALIAIPGYDRKDLRVGMSVELVEEVGDKFVARGFLVKANAAQAKDEKVLASVNKANAELTQANAVLVKANAALTEEIKALKKAK